MSKHLYRIGVGLHDHWLPNCPKYPFHFTEPKTGDRVWLITLDSETEELEIVPDTLLEPSNFYEEAKHQKDSGAPAYADKELLAPETYLIDFWIDKYSPGHGLDFGTEIFRTFDEAAFVLLQTFTDDYTGYMECLADLRKWRIEYGITGYFE